MPSNDAERAPSSLPENSFGMCSCGGSPRLSWAERVPDNNSWAGVKLYGRMDVRVVGSPPLLNMKCIQL